MGKLRIPAPKTETVDDFASTNLYLIPNNLTKL